MVGGLAMKTYRIAFCVLLVAGSLSGVLADDPPDLAKLLKERLEVARAGWKQPMASSSPGG
jgi:hypothetical protein